MVQTTWAHNATFIIDNSGSPKVLPVEDWSLLPGREKDGRLIVTGAQLNFSLVKAKFVRYDTCRFCKVEGKLVQFLLPNDHNHNSYIANEILCPSCLDSMIRQANAAQGGIEMLQFLLSGGR